MLLVPYTFVTPAGNRYIYDTLTNRIIFIDKYQISLHSGLIEAWSKGEMPKRRENDRIIDDEVNQLERTYALANKMINHSHESQDQVSYACDQRDLTGVSQLILKITDFCNFNCLYCRYYSGNEIYGQEKKTALSYHVATKAIDSFFGILNAHNRVTRYSRKTIGFYGGEPLLEFGLLKKIVDYSRKSVIKDSLCFNLTTNASLLNENIIRYLIDNDFRLLISLDGPAKEHDKCRLFRGGARTFDKVWSNVGKIRAISHKYFLRNVSFNAVYTDAHNLKDVKDFFDSPFFTGSHLRVSKASGLDKHFLKNYGLPDSVDGLSEMKRQYDDLRKKHKKCSSRYLDSLFGYRFSLLERREQINWHKAITQIISCSRINCIPGSTRIYVTTDGNYHMCERINRHFPIGDIHRGLDLDMINDIVNRFRSDILISCRYCRIMNLCDACYVPFSRKEKLMAGRTCDNARRSVLNDIEEFTAIKEEYYRV